ncbi:MULTISPECIES: TetR/AcrR family transcriptional regulator [unclassified Pseudoclavibacter]|uniref:TetR/AcrR family transcriptional regulator n=1 Tax=unclassified Pseudoclavibacter TaxID=2615177 RepID=UPI001BABE984|nr:TetR/AcrR family transcriptional regulator [Pseudoclavibacter sp. Marseille-Q4354]MBS3180385.1 TetR/AcrR family transcriptional regulator [Pseudoclavibacter sp. Marseille-Q4354]
MIQEDARFVRSRAALIAAVVELLDEGRDAAQLSITDIVGRAGVSRPTFYKHFDDTAALIREAALRRLQSAFDRIPSVGDDPSWPTFVRGTLRALLHELDADAPFYRAALESSFGLLTGDVIAYLATRLLESSPLGPVIRRRPGPDTPRDRAEFLAAGAMWHVTRWLFADVNVPVEADTNPTADSSAAARASTDELVERLSSLLLASSGATVAELDALRAEHVRS